MTIVLTVEIDDKSSDARIRARATVAAGEERMGKKIGDDMVNAAAAAYEALRPHVQEARALRSLRGAR